MASGARSQAEHVLDIGFLGMPDRAVAGRTLTLGAVLVTKDEEFATDPETQAAVPVVWLKVGNVSNRDLLSRLETEWPAIDEQLARGNRLVSYPLAR